MATDIDDPHVYTTTELTGIGECVRKWACKRLHRLPDPKHPKAQDGIDMHQILEQMLRHGPAANTEPESKIGKWARAVYPLAPPGAHPELEQSFELDLRAHATPADRFRSSFKIDWVRPDFTGFGDWKKTGAVKWALAGPVDAKAPDEIEKQRAAQQAALAGDMQANLETYGFAKTMGFERDRPVTLRWCYVEAEHGKAWPVDGALTFAQAEAWLAANALPRLRLIRAMRALRPAPPPAAIPHDITACGGTGRNCAFLGQCQFRQANMTTEQLYQLAQ